MSFFKDNKKAVEVLSKIIKEADSIKSETYADYDPEVRKLAISLVERWLQEVFDIENLDELPEQQDDDIYRVASRGGQ